MPKHGPAIRNRFLPTVLLTILLVFVPVIGGIGFGIAEAGGNTNGQLVAAANGGIGNNIQQAFGWDAANGTYLPALLSHSANNQTETIAFPKAQKISFVWIFTNNTKFDDKALLNSSNIYSYMNIKLTSTSESNLSNAFMYMGHALNASVSTAIGDKGVSNYIMNTTYYSSGTDKLGNSLELPTLQLLASSFTSTGIYYIGLSTKGTFSTNTTSGSTVSITFTQYFGHTVSYNILSGTEAITVVLGLLEIGFLYFAVPRHKEWEE